MVAALAKTAGAAVTALSLIGLLSYIIVHKSKPRLKSTGRKGALRNRPSGVVAAIGDTPLIRIDSLSDATGCEVSFSFTSSARFPFDCLLTDLSL